MLRKWFGALRSLSRSAATTVGELVGVTVATVGVSAEFGWRIGCMFAGAATFAISALAGRPEVDADGGDG